MINTIFCDLIVDRSMTVYMDDIAIHMACQKEEIEEEHIN